MNRVKNVIIINDFDYIQGGASKVAIDTANMLANNNYNVVFFSGATDGGKALNKKIINITTNQGESLEKKKIFSNIYNFKSKKTLNKLLKEFSNKNTIIHIHGWTKSLSSSVFSVCFKNNFQTVLTLHDYFTYCPNGGIYNYKTSKICRIIPMSLKCVFCNCDSRNFVYKIYRIIRHFVQQKIVGLNRKLKYAISISDLNLELLKNNFNKDTYIRKINNPFDKDASYKNDPKRNKYYLYIGRLSKEKAPDVFCDAVTEAGVKGIVIGDGPELKQLKANYKNITFTGWINQKEIGKYYLKAKAVVIPSRWYEGASLIPMEASCYNVPCITSKTCAAKEFIPSKNIYSNYDELVSILKNDDISYKIPDFKNSYFKDLTNFYEHMLREER